MTGQPRPVMISKPCVQEEHTLAGDDGVDAVPLFIDWVSRLLAALTRRPGPPATEISAALRILLVDGGALLERANRVPQLAIAFPFPQSATDAEPPRTWWRLDLLKTPNGAITALSKDQFLATKLGAYEGGAYNVRDLIKFAANVMGGVHAGKIKSDADRTIQSLRDLSSVDSMTLVETQLEQVAALALTGLQPLIYICSASAHSLERRVRDSALSFDSIELPRSFLITCWTMASSKNEIG